MFHAPADAVLSTRADSHRVIAFAGATASAGPGGATATAGAGGIAAEVAAAASEAVTHAQNGNCFAAQVALMAAQQQLALTTGENNLTAPKKGRIRHIMAAVQVALMVAHPAARVDDR